MKKKPNNEWEGDANQQPQEVANMPLVVDVNVVRSPSESRPTTGVQCYDRKNTISCNGQNPPHEMRTISFPSNSTFGKISYWDHFPVKFGSNTHTPRKRKIDSVTIVLSI